MLLLYWVFSFAMAVNLFSGLGCYTLQGSPWGLLSWIFSGGAAALRPNILWSTPPPQIHHRDYIDTIPLNAKVSGA